MPDVAPLPERLHRALVVVPSHERHSVNRRNAVQRGDTGEGGAGSSAAALARDLDSLGLGLGARPPGAHPARHGGPWVAESPATGPTVHPTEPAAGSCPASRWRSRGGGRRAPVDKAHEPASAVRTAIARPLEGSLTVTTRLAALLPELSTSVCGRTEPLPAERPSKTIDSWDARVRPDLLCGRSTALRRRMCRPGSGRRGLPHSCKQAPGALAGGPGRRAVRSGQPPPARYGARQAPGVGAGA